MTTVAALFIDPKGHYPYLLGRNHCWDVSRDARTFAGNTSAVVAHPPCFLWVNMACVNWKRYGRQKPAWLGGTDGGCFASALQSVRRCGGVLEHPAGSHAWEHFDLLPPDSMRAPDPTEVAFGATGWVRTDVREWVCEVWQSAYGHKARKRTWLLYCGARPPFELDWTRQPGTHQVGWFDRNKPTLGKREASKTTIEFAKELIRLAKWSQG